LKSPRGKRLTLLIASAALAVLLGAAFASKDVVLTTWYAYLLRNGYFDEQRRAIISLGQLRTKRAGRILAAYLGGEGSLRNDANYALISMGEVALEPLGEAFSVVDDLLAEPKKLPPDDIRELADILDSLLGSLLAIQRKEAGVRLLHKNIGTRFLQRDDLEDFGDEKVKYLVWNSGVKSIEGKPCRIFLFNPSFQSWPGLQPQTILITDAGGRVITWKEVGGEPSFRSCELEIVDGAVYLDITCDERHSRTPGKYAYRLTLRGIE
jgi:hypothetical protein